MKYMQSSEAVMVECRSIGVTGGVRIGRSPEACIGMAVITGIETAGISSSKGAAAGALGSGILPNLNRGG